MNDGTAYFVMPLAALVNFFNEYQTLLSIIQEVVPGPCTIKTL
jgi:hypothetical protein